VRPRRSGTADNHVVATEWPACMKVRREQKDGRYPGTRWHAFRPSAYWFWHSIPDDGACRRRLTDFKAQGIPDKSGLAAALRLAPLKASTWPE